MSCYGSIVTDGADLVTIRFNGAITDRDLDRLASLMTEDHAFVDTAGRVVDGRAAAVEAWRGFFAAYPGYRSVFTTVLVDEELVLATGYSEGTDPALDGPAIWVATIHEGLVAQWRVFDDTAENRRRLGLP